MNRMLNMFFKHFNLKCCKCSLSGELKKKTHLIVIQQQKRVLSSHSIYKFTAKLKLKPL